MHKHPLARLSKPFKGFTLVELLLVILILAILISLSISIIDPDRLKARVRDSQRKKDLEVISLALEQYYADNNSYPNGDIGTVDNALSSTDKYLKDTPADPKAGYSYCYQASTFNQQNYILCAVLETDDNDRPSPDATVGLCSLTPDPAADDTLGRYCITNPL